MSRSRIIDIAIAVALGILLAESPFTPDDRGPSLAIGAIAALWFFWYRTTHQAAVRPGAARSASEDALRVWRALSPVGWLCVAVWVAIFAPTLAWMYGRWTGSFWHNNHSLVTAVLMVLMANGTLRREARKGTLWDLSPWGLVFVALGCSLAAVDANAFTHQTASIGFVISLPGMALLLLGVQRARALALPLAMAAFLIPLPSLVANHLYLRTITAEWTLWLLQAAGFRVSLFYSRLELPTEIFEVTEACSGFSTLIAAVVLSMFLISLCSSPRRRVAVVLAILPLTLAANTLRVVLLVMLSLFVGVEVLDTMLHEASGVVAFVIVVGSLFWIADRPPILQAFR